MITMPNTDSDMSRYTLPQADQAGQETGLGQDAFLKLMLVQLQNQDPMQPMEDGQFIAQLAQFSTVEKVGSMSDSLDSLAGSLTASTALQASTMVGRSVLVEGNTGTLGEDAPLKAGIDLPVPLNNAVVRIFNANGELMREMPLGARDQGVATFEWDGTTTDGEPAEPGTYYIDALYRNGENEEALPTLISSKVESVALNGGTNAEITTSAGQRVGLSQVRAIM